MSLASPYDVVPGQTITIAAADIITPTGVTLAGSLTLIVRKAGSYEAQGTPQTPRATVEVSSNITAVVT